MKTHIKMIGQSTVRVDRDLKDKLTFIKIKTRAKNLNEVIRRLIK